MKFKQWIESKELDDLKAGLWITVINGQIDVSIQKAQKITQWFNSQYGNLGYKIKFNPLGYADRHRAVIYVPNKYAEHPGFPQIPDLVSDITNRFM